MSEYKYTDLDGDTVTFSRAINGGVVVVASDSATSAVARIEPTDVPSVAAELLKAAGQEGAFVPKAKDEVRMDRTFPTIASCGYGPSLVHVAGGSDPIELGTTAANYIAIAEYIESKATREADAEKKLQERRDALATEFSMGAYSYEVITPMVKFAIDRIIELEDERDAA